ncbi:hypothetical protein AA106556_0311 [Neokomagataea tanensis NBRC 106556]|uniref:Uncharacterized protein n=1 Tax=Neokomagataea tanensis NBRC 106556 TaxID=1223519 RepID=A0ABQ0QGM6_9PROT|nr:hypothetical protein AA106556_0311 [Neokomagataea tanensis NBRC 106556]
MDEPRPPARMRDEAGFNAIWCAGAGMYGKATGFVDDQVVWTGVEKREVLSCPEEGRAFLDAC